MAAEIINRIKKFKEKYNENCREIKVFFDKELNEYLLQSGNENYTAEERESLIKVLDEALELVESGDSYAVIMLQRAQINALKSRPMYCKCKNDLVFMRQDSKEVHDRRGKNAVDSGISNISSTDSRVLSDPGDAPVVQPSDASDFSANK